MTPEDSERARKEALEKSEAIRERRRRKTQEEALESMCSRGEITIKLPPDAIRDLYKMAGELKKPAGQLAREYLERSIKEDVEMFYMFSSFEDGEDV